MPQVGFCWPAECYPISIKTVASLEIADGFIVVVFGSVMSGMHSLSWLWALGHGLVKIVVASVALWGTVYLRYALLYPFLFYLMMQTVGMIVLLVLLICARFDVTLQQEFMSPFVNNISNSAQAVPAVPTGFVLAICLVTLYLLVYIVCFCLVIQSTRFLVKGQPDASKIQVQINNHSSTGSTTATTVMCVSPKPVGATPICKSQPVGIGACPLPGALEQYGYGPTPTSPAPVPVTPPLTSSNHRSSRPLVFVEPGVIKPYPSKDFMPTSPIPTRAPRRKVTLNPPGRRASPMNSKTRFGPERPSVDVSVTHSMATLATEQTMPKKTKKRRRSCSVTSSNSQIGFERLVNDRSSKKPVAVSSKPHNNSVSSHHSAADGQVGFERLIQHLPDMNRSKSMNTETSRNTSKQSSLNKNPAVMKGKDVPGSEESDFSYSSAVSDTYESARLNL